MKCVDCELHDCVVGTHFCNYKGESGRRRPRRISEEDAHKDIPCEYVEERNEDERSRGMTNLDYIRTLSAEELADLLYDYWLPRGSMLGQVVKGV